MEAVAWTSLTGTKFPQEDGNENQTFSLSCVFLVCFFVFELTVETKTQTKDSLFLASQVQGFQAWDTTPH